MTAAAAELVDPPTLAPGTVVGERFVVEGPLGVGGMGAVYEARDTVIERVVALKILTAENERAIVRFQQEARAASRISSRHVSAIHDFGHDPEHGFFMVLERLKGTPLDAVMIERGALEPSVATAIGADIAEALDAAHQAGVVHRDLKPANVWMLDSGGLKVIDFGIARMLGAEGRASSSVTAPDTIVGTPRYISPEAVEGAEVGPHADLYALGVIVFEMLAGDPPFWDDNAMALCTLHLRESAPRIESVCPELALPDGLGDLIAALLEKSPSLRPRSAREIADQLRAMSDIEGVVRVLGDGRAAADTAEIARIEPGGAQRSTRRLYIALATAATLLFALATSITVAVWPAPEESTVGVTLPARRAEPPAREAPPIATPEPVVAPSAIGSPVQVTVRTTPSDAELHLDGEPIDATFELAPDGAEHTLEVRRRGYRDARRTLVADRDQAIEVVLARRPRSREELPARIREW